ncbi:hypothetical protein [Allomuricauda sp. d1]|uniref:MORN repeat-containing protein n=1 Tax=Allomuricauda sp. d1 TaxID=3136725 RepID=UPI0031D3FF6A
MKGTKRQLITYALLGLATAFAVFYGFKAYKLKQELKAEVEKEAEIQKEVESHQKLLRIDSMLVEGEYSSALRAYNAAFDNKDIDDVAGVQLRIDIAEQLLRMKSGEHPSQAALAVRDSLDSIQMRLASMPLEVRQYDSISFALEKTKVQLANMRSQLQRKSFGEYLQFTNSKGSQMHYVGQVSGKKANGYGVALLNTGSRYEGEWKDNQRHGEGSFYWSDGEYYVGSYENDQRNGLGTYYWPNGEKYVGSWKDDKRNGKGIFYGKDGNIITEGIWKADKLVEAEKKEKNNGR